MNLPKRTLIVIPVATALALATGGGTAAAVTENANCIGELVVGLNQTGERFGIHGQGGQANADVARTFGGVAFFATQPFC